MITEEKSSGARVNKPCFVLAADKGLNPGKSERGKGVFGKRKALKRKRGAVATIRSRRSGSPEKADDAHETALALRLPKTNLVY